MLCSGRPSGHSGKSCVWSNDGALQQLALSFSHLSEHRVCTLQAFLFFVAARSRTQIDNLVSKDRSVKCIAVSHF